MLKVYGNLETCPKCKIIHKQLEENGVDFEFIDDEKEVMKVAEENGIGSIPFAIQVLTFTDLIKYSKGV